MRVSTFAAGRDGPRLRAGFTLIELLIVVAVIGMLMALSLPAIQQARLAAQRSDCASNLRQIGIAIHQYANVHNGRLPQDMHNQGQVEGDKRAASWIFSLGPYCEQVDSIRICWGDPKAGKRVTSYVINEYLTTPSIKGAVTNLRRVPSHGKTMMLFEVADAVDEESETGEFYYDHVHSHLWFSTANIAKKKVFEAIKKDIQTDRHSGHANYLYADSRVELISEEQIANWATLKMNFAKPQ